MISGSHGGAASVIIGTAVQLSCIFTRGLPQPTLSWGAARPAGATLSASGSAIVMNIPALLERTCIECIGENPAGRDVDQECIDVTSMLRCIIHNVLSFIFFRNFRCSAQRFQRLSNHHKIAKSIICPAGDP